MIALRKHFNPVGGIDDPPKPLAIRIREAALLPFERNDRNQLNVGVFCPQLQHGFSRCEIKTNGHTAHKGAKSTVV